MGANESSQESSDTNPTTQGTFPTCRMYSHPEISLCAYNLHSCVFILKSQGALTPSQVEYVPCVVRFIPEIRNMNSHQALGSRMCLPYFQSLAQEGDLLSAIPIQGCVFVLTGN